MQKHLLWRAFNVRLLLFFLLACLTTPTFAGDKIGMDLEWRPITGIPKAPPPAPETARLYVDAEPSGATVRILNIAPRFYQGIELEPGRYHLEVSVDGYETHKEWISVSAGGDKRVLVALAPVRKIPEPRIAQSGRPGQIWTDPVTGMEFVWAPGGCYQMGCGSWTDNCDGDEKPVHRGVSGRILDGEV